MIDPLDEPGYRWIWTNDRGLLVFKPGRFGIHPAVRLVIYDQPDDHEDRADEIQEWFRSQGWRDEFDYWAEHFDLDEDGNERTGVEYFFHPDDNTMMLLLKMTWGGRT